MRRIFLPTLVVLCFALGVAAQAELVNLKVQAVLIDKNLNLKPVPKLAFALRRLDDGEELQLKTGFDGLAEIDLPPGRYQLSTLRPVEFQGVRYTWDLDLVLQEAQTKIDLSNDNAVVEEGLDRPVRIVDDLTQQFKHFQDSVVTVWSEIGHGTGFIVDKRGLVLTNQHVIGPSEYVAIQFDERPKLPAVLLGADPEKDVAVLWANVSAIPEAVVAPIAIAEGDEPPVVEGERVFTIGSPLSQRKILTTGIVSKVEERANISDININPGNSGGPLFSSLGFVVGLTTFGEQRQAGPGISGIVRIEEALPLLSEAEEKMVEAESPPASFLPVEPTDKFPLDAIKTALEEREFKIKPYTFDQGGFDVAIITPPLYYYLQQRTVLAAAKRKGKRTKKKQKAIKGTFQPLESLRSWAEYAGGYKPVIFLRASPKLKETFWSAFGRGLAAAGGALYTGQARMRFKTDFYRMRLLCGGEEVPPIQPSKIATIIDVNNAFVKVTDATYEGFYVYPPDAISPECGQVVLQLYSEKKPERPQVKVLNPKTVARVWEDFEPYRQMLAASTPTIAGERLPVPSTDGCYAYNLDEKRNRITFNDPAIYVIMPPKSERNRLRSQGTPAQIFRMKDCDTPDPTKTLELYHRLGDADNPPERIPSTIRVVILVEKK